MTTSQGSPASRRSRITPTAPKSPWMAKPVCALNRSCSCETRPFAAPPLRRRTSPAMSVELDICRLDHVRPFGDVGVQVFVEFRGLHHHRHRAVLGPDLPHFGIAG